MHRRRLGPGLRRPAGVLYTCLHTRLATSLGYRTWGLFDQLEPTTDIDLAHHLFRVECRSLGPAITTLRPRSAQAGSASVRLDWALQPIMPPKCYYRLAEVLEVDMAELADSIIENSWWTFLGRLMQE